MLRAFLIVALLASVAANAWFINQNRTVAQSRATPPPKNVSVNSSTISSAEKAPSAAPTLTTTPTTDADFRALRSQLETAGLPPEVVKMAVSMMIHRSFQKRRNALMNHPGPDEYWRNRSIRPNQADQVALRELEREQRKLLREATDGDFEFDEDSQRRQFGGLPQEKVTRLKKIMADYADLEEQLFSDIPDRSSPEARARNELLTKEKRADIERLLTPEELLNYDLRNSPASHRLRGLIGQFQATEAEFLALFPAAKAMSEIETGMTAGGPRSPATADARRAREDAQQKLEAEMRRILGEARYAEMKEANDHAVQQTRQFAASLNLPPASAAELVAVQKDFAPKLSAVERDRDLTANQRDAQLYALGNEARERLTRVLGADGFEAYKRRGGGWLGAALNRAPPTPSPSPPR
jgi:hypothetical protein